MGSGTTRGPLFAVLVLAALLLAVPAAAMAQSGKGSGYRHTSKSARFGAIAYHRASRAWGVSYDKASARDASVEALNQCAQRECIVIHKFKNGCAALADGPKIQATASGATRDEAETKALQRCGAGCKTIAWACTR